MNIFNRYPFTRLSALPIALLLAACGGGTASGPAPSESAAVPTVLSANPVVVAMPVPVNDSTAAPAVIFTYPVDASSGLGLNSKIVAGFNTPMKPSALASPATAFTLKDAVSGTPVAGTVTYDAASKSATFATAVDLSPSTRYIAAITMAATDENGAGLSRDTTWSFTTGTARDTTAPVVAQPTSPGHAETGVALDKVIRITFNEPMDPSSITADTFHVYDPSDVRISGTVALNAQSNTASFVPANKFAPNMKYKVFVTPEAKDLAGNALANEPWVGFLYWFYTGAAQ